MDLLNKDLSLLFKQLGLASDQASIDAFIARHYPLPDDVKVSGAPFWNESQAAFLKESIMDDADWEPVVDELNVLLHRNEPHH